MTATSPGWLEKERIIAGPGFIRWLVPPAALAIHLCIGMAYGFSVFWLPLSKALGIKEAIKCGPDVGFATVPAYLAVGLPLCWGVYRTTLSVAKFFA